MRRNPATQRYASDAVDCCQVAGSAFCRVQLRAFTSSGCCVAGARTVSSWGYGYALLVPSAVHPFADRMSRWGTWHRATSSHQRGGCGSWEHGTRGQTGLPSFSAPRRPAALMGQKSRHVGGGVPSATPFGRLKRRAVNHMRGGGREAQTERVAVEKRGGSCGRFGCPQGPSEPGFSFLFWPRAVLKDGPLGGWGLVYRQRAPTNRQWSHSSGAHNTPQTQGHRDRMVLRHQTPASAAPVNVDVVVRGHLEGAVGFDRGQP